MIFKKATQYDIEAVSTLYGDVCDYLSSHINYPGWQKDIYPAKADAQSSFDEGTLYICRGNNGNAIIGSVVLKHAPGNCYSGEHWLTPDDYEKIYVIHTLAVHPDYNHLGVGKYMMNAIEEMAKKEHCISIRLDVVKGNVPAEKLYQKCGYQYITTKSLGYEDIGLPWFNLYEKPL